jgi:hypothetical protein
MACSRPESICLPSRHLEIHEIERRSAAPNRWWSPCNALLLCPKCHATDFAAMPHARQLAIKLVKDPEDFDLDEWLLIKDPTRQAPERVTWSDIAQYLEVLL